MTLSAWLFSIWLPSGSFRPSTSRRCTPSPARRTTTSCVSPARRRWPCCGRRKRGSCWTAWPGGRNVAAAIGFTSFDLPRAAAIAADILSTDSSGQSVAALLPPFLQRQGGTAALAAALRREAADARRREAGVAPVERRWPAGPAALRRVELRRWIFERTQKIDAWRKPSRWPPKSAPVATPSAARRFSAAPSLAASPATRSTAQGGNIGPDLSALGTAQPVDFIIGAILEPQKEIKEGYHVAFGHDQGRRRIPGLSSSRNRDELVLRDVLAEQGSPPAS